MQGASHSLSVTNDECRSEEVCTWTPWGAFLVRAVWNITIIRLFSFLISHNTWYPHGTNLLNVCGIVTGDVTL